jgi:hypothetical protein
MCQLLRQRRICFNIKRPRSSSLGSTLGIAATPSFIVGNVAILGYPGRYRLQAIVDAASSCGKVVC